MNDVIEQRKESGKNTFATNILKKIKILYICQYIIGNYRDSFFFMPQKFKTYDRACMSFDPGLR